jgi:dolichol-phosphate mannosyltransferase
MTLSVIVPFFNECECVLAVLEEIRFTLPDAEIVAVDDGSTDGTASLIASVPGVRLIRMGTNCGQSAALFSGLTSATGEVLAMMDGDGQYDPTDIPGLARALENADVVYGIRATRRDSFARRAASNFANSLRRAILGDQALDTCCTLKLIRREHVKFLVLFDGMHRYLPAIFAASGLTAAQIPVTHRPRRAGHSKYTIRGRAFRGIFDLIGVKWLLARRIPWRKENST